MQKNNNTVVFIFFLFLSMLVFILWKLSILNTPFSFLSNILNPIRSTELLLVKGKTDWNSFQKMVQSKAEKKLMEDNAALRDQFAVTTPVSQTLLPAKIIGEPSMIPGIASGSFFILNRGKEDGVKKDQAVVFMDNLVGRISDVNDHSSKVILVTHRSFSFTGKLEDGSLGVVRGAGQGVEVDNILLSENVNVGSLVLSRGDQNEEGIGIPPDLVVGKIVSVEKKTSDLFQKANVLPLVDFEKIQTVFVITK